MIFTFTKIQYIEVRWSSLFQVLQRFLEQKEAIDFFVSTPDAAKQNIPKITGVEWDKIRMVGDVLGVLNKIFLHLQRRRTSIGEVIPIYITMRKELDLANYELDMSTWGMREAIIKDMEERMKAENWDENK